MYDSILDRLVERHNILQRTYEKRFDATTAFAGSPQRIEFDTNIPF
ncbi:MAG: hypothetical protein R3C28_26060 [Pirellulaceae bacterium]